MSERPRSSADAVRRADGAARRRRLSLGTKLSLGIVLVVAAAVLGVSTKFADSARDNLVESKRAAATAFADLFAASIAPAVDFHDEDSMQAHLGHFRARADALQLIVWTMDGTSPILNSLSDGGEPTRPQADSSVVVEADRVVVTRPITNPTGRIGIAQFSFSLADENRAAAAARQRIMLGALLLGIVLAALMLVMVRFLVGTPLRELLVGIRQLQAGELPSVRVRANDEMGELAAAFNAMAATIHERGRQLSQANRELQEVSLTDPLTGLRNRRFFAETVRQEAARSARRHSTAPGVHGRLNRDVILMLIDLDHFKAINDTLGHDAGDEVLRQTARRLLAAMRQSDFVVRWGGEEFLVVARDSERADAAVIADRLLRAVGSVPYELEGGTSMRVTCSLGWVPFPWHTEAESSMDMDRLIQVADKGLYHAKQAGRNRATGIMPRSGCLRDAVVPDLPLDELDGDQLVLTRTAGPEA